MMGTEPPRKWETEARLLWLGPFSPQKAVPSFLRDLGGERGLNCGISAVS